MVERLSSASVFYRAFNNIGTTQHNLNKSFNQISSGSIYSNFMDMVSDSELDNILSLESHFQIVSDYHKNNDVIIDRLNATDLALSGMVDIAAEMIKNVTLKKSSSGNTINLESISKSNLGTLLGQLNSQFENRYIFAGTRTNEIPVGDIVNNTNVFDDVITANYYKGDSVILEAIVSDSLTVSYGITANDDTFTKLIAAMHYAIKADREHSDNDLGKALDLLNEAVDGLSNLRSYNGNNLRAIENANTIFDNEILYLNNVLAEITKTNEAEVTLKMATDMSILTASYMAFSKISELTLTKFL